MKEIEYQTHYSSGGIEELIFKNDSTNFRWTRKVFGVPDGLNFLSDKKIENSEETLTFEYFNGLILTVKRRVTDDGIVEEYTLKNPTDKEIEINEDYSVKISFADDADIAAVALPRRAYLRIFFGGTCFAAYNSRMGGQPDGVGVVLVDGKIEKIRKENLTKKSVSVLTCFFENATLAKNEEISFSWLIFGYESENEFFETVSKYMPFFRLERYPVFEDDELVVITDDRLIADGFETENEKINFSRTRTLKVERGERYYETVIKPLTKLEYFKKIAELYPENTKSLICLYEILESGSYEKERIVDYLKKSKKTFDVCVPFDVIKSDEDLLETYLQKIDLALSDIKGVFTPYKLLARYEYLSDVSKIVDDVRVIDKLDCLKPLVDAFNRLNSSLNEL